MMREKIAATALAIALSAAALAAPSTPLLGRATDHGLHGISRCAPPSDALDRQYHHLLGFFSLPASLGLIGPVAANLVLSVQSWSLVISNGSSTGTATVSSASTTLSSLHHNGNISGQDLTIDGRIDLASLAQTDATTITATRTGTTGAVTVYGVLIEWKSSAVKSVQMGTISITSTNTSNTASLGSSVTTTNACVVYTGTQSSIAGTMANVMCRLNLTSSTVVTSTRATGTSATIVTGYCVIEWQAGILNSGTQEATTAISSGTTANSTISAITTGQAWLAYGGQTNVAAASWTGQYRAYAYLAGTTTITAVIQTANVINIVTTVVEFRAAHISSIARGHATPINHATNAYADATVSFTATTLACAFLLGWTSTSGSHNRDGTTLISARLSSNTNIRLQRGLASSNEEQTASWEGLEFNP